MTSLVPQVQTSALEGAADLESVLKNLANRKIKSVSEQPSAAPKLVPVTPEQKEAVTRLNDELATTNFPTTRRLLSPGELLQILSLTSDAKLARKAAEAAEAAAKTAVFSHFDVGLEHSNPEADIPRDPKTGHYLVDGEIVVGDTGQRFTRETRQASPVVTAADLLKLVEAGKMSRNAYMRATHHIPAPRVLAEDGLMAELKRDPSLLEALAEVVEPGTVTASFWVRDLKKS